MPEKTIASPTSQSELAELAEQVSELAEITRIYELKLAPVLLPPPPASPAAEKAEAEPSGSAMTIHLKLANLRLRCLRARLCEVLNRLDLPADEFFNGQKA